MTVDFFLGIAYGAVITSQIWFIVLALKRRESEKQKTGEKA